MILVDYSQTVIAAATAGSFSSKKSTTVLDEDLMRHIILNTLRSYVVKFSKKYGQLVICADGRQSWRKNYYPQYKANRAKNREASPIDWKVIFDTMTNVLVDMRDTLSLFPAVRLENAEADDIIAVLTKSAFKRGEKVLIISSDKDMRQLLKYQDVEQWSPRGEFIKEKDPSGFLVEHIIRGDSGDGIPNVFSDDDCFIDDSKRQVPATKKKIQTILDALYSGSPMNEVLSDGLMRNWDRNKTLIDLEMIPDDIQKAILNEFEKEEAKSPEKAAFLGYLVKHKMRNLISCIGEFFGD